MKKVFILSGLMLIMLVFCACSGQNVKNDEQLNIVTSFYPMYIATANIVDGVEDVTLTNLTASTTGCLHDYQITTNDMIKLSNADVLIVNGDGMENFIDKAIKTYDKLSIITASEGIKDNHEELIAEHEDKSGEHSHDHEENSHYWVSISLYIEQIKNIENGLCRIDPDNSSKYKENAENYIKKLNDLKIKMHESLDDIENKDIVTFHEAFLYFAEEFDLNVVAVIEREPGTYPSSRDVAQIIDEVRSKKVKAIFVEPQYSRTAADTIAKETGVKVYNLDPIVTGKLDKDAYITTMENNLKILKEALDS